VAPAQFNPFRAGPGLSPEDNRLLFEGIARLNTAEPTKTGMLGHQQLVRLRQHVEERQPLRHAACTVQEKDLRTIPCSAELYGNSPDLSSVSSAGISSAPSTKGFP
jgi:hypothetical protein